MRRSMVSSGGSYKWPYGGSINVTRDTLAHGIRMPVGRRRILQTMAGSMAR